MVENPFTYGNPISNPSRFYGRQVEVRQIFSRLLNAEAESSSIVGERRIGKTSLLQYLTRPETRKNYGANSDQLLMAYIDLEMAGEKITPTLLWKRFLAELERRCPDSTVKEIISQMKSVDEIDNFSLADLFSTIQSSGYHIVFLLDEFEKVISNKNFAPDFFYGLRSLAIHYHLTLITSSRNELIELTHSNEIRSSPFFNIFANINVRSLTQDQALEMIDQNLKSTGIQFSQPEIKYICRIAGLHPFFFQVACHFLFSAYQQKLDHSARLGWVKKEYMEEVSGHLHSYWNDSTDNERIVLTAMALLSRQGKAGDRSFKLENLQNLYSRSQQTLSKLEKRSLLVESPDGYGLFNDAFGEWIIGEISDTMNDQQNFEDWINTNRSLMDRLSKEGKQQFVEVLPKIGARYRDLLIEWVSDPKNLVTVGILLKSALGGS